MSGYKLPSTSTVLFSLFSAYIAYSAWTLGQLFITPTCTKAGGCLEPLIADGPQLQLLAFSSERSRPDRSRDLYLIHQEEVFNYHEAKETTITVPLPGRVRKNGTLYLYLFLTSPTVDPEDWMDLAKNPLTVWASVPLTQYHIPEAETFNLLSDKNKSNRSHVTARQVNPVTHFQSQVAFNILTQPVSLPRNAIPHEIARLLRLSPSGRYLPLLYVDQLSLRLRDLVQVDTAMKETNLTLKYSPISFGKIRLWLQFEGALQTMSGLGFTAKDLDEVKGIFSDSNLYLLCVTFLVAALHLLFDFLAFKNDIAFWKGRDNTGGISPSSVAWRAFAQVVIVLFLMEEETSLLVLIPAGIGVIIEVWKVKKAYHIELDGWWPQLKGAQTSEESQTRQLDSEGFRYLSYVLYPLCAGGAVYSLLYTPHKSWYSWIINSLVNGVYAFGFLFMLPQLFINYKLKSVAHLPWRAFMYKAFNTFIDDLFAFIITMPMAHRVACFRDDVIFVIYLYQRWLYPVDKTRVNEFGQTGEEHHKKD